MDNILSGILFSILAIVWFYQGTNGTVFDFDKIAIGFVCIGISKIDFLTSCVKESHKWD